MFKTSLLALAAAFTIAAAPAMALTACVDANVHVGDNQNFEAKQNCDVNMAGSMTHGNNNSAKIKQKGKKNTAIGSQDGDGNTLLVKQRGKKNDMSGGVDGDGNTAIIDQGE
jgi:hypothetical protein